MKAYLLGPLVGPDPVAPFPFGGKLQTLFVSHLVGMREDWVGRYWAALMKDPCVYCGQLGREMSVEHVTPRSEGGGIEWTNVAGACRGCNSERLSAPLWFYLLCKSQHAHPDPVQKRCAHITATSPYLVRRALRGNA